MRVFLLLLLALFSFPLAAARAEDGPIAGELHTPRFRIRYTAKAQGAARELAKEIEATRSSFQAVLGRDWPGVTEVRVGVGRTELEALALPGHRPPGWAVALAYPAENLILLEALSLTEPQNAATVRHELSHVALGQLGKQWPRWFQEGVAQRLTGDGGGLAQYTSMVQALYGEQLFPMEDLVTGWPDRPSDVQLAYAQSASFVSYLLDLYGPEGFALLLDFVGEGDPFPTAFGKAFRTSPRLAEESWKADLPDRYSWWPVITAGSTVWALATAIFLLAVWRRRTRKAQALERMQQEDEAADRADLEIELATLALEQPPPEPNQPEPHDPDGKPTVH